MKCVCVGVCEGLLLMQRACVRVWLNSSVSILPRVLHHFSTSKSHQRNLAWGKIIDPPSYCPKGEQFRNTRPSVWNYPTSTFEWNILWKKQTNILIEFLRYFTSLRQPSYTVCTCCGFLLGDCWAEANSSCVMWLCAADGAQCRMLIKATVLCSKWGCCCHVFFLPFGGRA